MVYLEEQSNIIRKLVFRLVRKHIAGSTSGAVLNVVRDLNKKGFHATVTLLNEHVDDQAKAKYNTAAYMQFIRQLSRLHLNSDVSMRLSQIGYGLDNITFEKNFQSVIDVANSCKQRIWIEDEANLGTDDIMPIYRKFKPKCNSLGAEIQPNYDQIDGKGMLVRSISSKDMIKLRYRAQEKKKKGAEKIDRFKLYKEYLDTLIGKRVNLTVLEDDPKLINRIIASNKDYKKNLIFEIPLGYSNKTLALLQKNKINSSVYVPYGKDWIPYLINRLAEGRVRNIAVALLNGQKTNVGSNVKNEGAKAG